MAKLSEIVSFLDRELNTEGIPDYSAAHNGLQLENSSGRVAKVSCAVDATAPVIEKAVAEGSDLLIVHHGLFWQGVQKLSGVNFRKLEMAISGGLAIYSSHIPLDIHPGMGNNVLLVRALCDRADWTPAFDWKGILLGYRATLEMPFGELKEKFKKVLATPLLGAHGDPAESCGKTLVITGGAGGEVLEVANQGYKTFITGEAPHWAHGICEEQGLKLLLGGHYATETLGVQALGDSLAQKFDLSCNFIDHPSGL